jgi:hypothetical protein
MYTVTFIIIEKNSPDGRFPFTILRMSDRRQDVVSYHSTKDEAAEAANRYASQAKFSGLDAVIFQKDWMTGGARTALR